MAATKNQQFVTIDNQLINMQIIYKYYHEDLDAVEDETLRTRNFVEMNVQEQVYDLVKTSIVQNAQKRNQPLHIYSSMYDINDGFINDLGGELFLYKRLM